MSIKELPSQKGASNVCTEIKLIMHKVRKDLPLRIKDYKTYAREIDIGAWEHM